MVTPLKPSDYAKAIVGAVLAGLMALTTAMAEGGVVGSEWVSIAVAALSTFGAVFVVPNRQPTP